MTTAAERGSAKLPEHLQFDENLTSNVVETFEDRRFAAVLFVGDVLTQQIKQAPLLRHGGRLTPQCVTVPNRYLATCAITPLVEDFYPVNAQLLPKTQATNFIQWYTKKNVLIDAATNKRGAVTIGKGRNDRHLVFKRVLPRQEIGTLAHQNNGCVEVPNVSSAKDCIEAQLHYFPDWARIVRGGVKLPSTIRELREWIENRKAKTMSAAVVAIGEAYLTACDQYEIWGKEYVDRQAAAIEDSRSVKGFTQRYDEIGERLLTVLELARKDSLMEDVARSIAHGTANAGGMDPEMRDAFKAMMTGIQVLANAQGIPIGGVAPQGEEAKVPDVSAESHFDGLAEEVEIETSEGEEAEESSTDIEIDEDADTDEADVTTDPAEQEDDLLAPDAPLTDEEKARGHCSDVNSEKQPCGAKPTHRVDDKLYCKHHPRATEATEE